MEYINASLYGIIQGITEFLPISSSGHLVLLHEFLQVPFKDEIIFDVILHLASLFAVFLFFRKDILKITVSWIKSFKGEKSNQSRLAWYIIFATIPAGVAGLFFEKIIETYLRSPIVVVFMLVFVAILFLFLEKKVVLNKEFDKISFKDSLFIGFSQVLALVPGTSRSGITIITALTLKIKREAAIRFSFLLSIPIILGASIKKIPVLFTGTFLRSEYYLLFLAFISTFITAYFVIKLFLKFAQNNTFKVFAYYRIILALVVLLVLYLF